MRFRFVFVLCIPAAPYQMLLFIQRLYLVGRLPLVHFIVHAVIGFCRRWAFSWWFGFFHFRFGFASCFLGKGEGSETPDRLVDGGNPPLFFLLVSAFFLCPSYIQLHERPSRVCGML